MALDYGRAATTAEPFEIKCISGATDRLANLRESFEPGEKSDTVPAVSRDRGSAGVRIGEGRQGFLVRRPGVPSFSRMCHRIGAIASSRTGRQRHAR